MENTIKNLAKAFAGESQARNRYRMFASIARNEGFEQIAEIFSLTEDNERMHAKTFYNLLKGLNPANNTVVVETAVPVIIGNTAENLKASINGENEEYTKLYPEFAIVAEQEGLIDIANKFKAVSIAEQHHEERYKKLLEVLEAGKTFKKDTETYWVCRECGYVHFGTEALEKCPSCDHARAFYQIKCETY